MRIFFLSIFVFVTSIGNAFDNQYNKHDCDTKITSFVLMGERCSGTKFVSNLIVKNLSITKENFFHKHFVPWLNLSEKEKVNQFQLTKQETTNLFKNTDDKLFIFLVRDPYDWIRSFFNHPHHVKETLVKDFTTFISTDWECDYQKDNPGIAAIDNYNPWKGKKFRNVLQLRKYKNLNFLQVSHAVKNYLFVRYEDVRDNQEGFIEFLSTYYNLKKKGSFEPTLSYVGFGANNLEFEIPKYFIPTYSQVTHINRFIDWNLEKNLGYFEKSRSELIQDVKQLN